MDTDNFLNKYNPLLCKFFLAASDFIFFNVSLALSIGCVYWIFNDLYRFIPDNQLEMRIISHIILSIICVGWFWVRLRHYSYRKPFWFELKEIIRTIVIFAVFDWRLLPFLNGSSHDMCGFLLDLCLNPASIL